VNILHAIVLGAIQGIAEFLPISSSAHLVIAQNALHWQAGEQEKLFFDVLLHLGTLIALVAYFWRDWRDMIKANIELGKQTDRSEAELAALKAKSMPLWPIIAASIPGALFGVLLEKKMDKVHDPRLIGAAMIGLAILLFIADRRSVREGRSMQKVTMKDWLTVGLAQALAVVPGVSRSGITITAGLFCGLKREAAARFSFLLGAPIIFGAAVWELRKFGQIDHSQWPAFIAGLLTSAIVGYLCIGFLMEYLKKRSMTLFVVYRILFGITIICVYMMGGLR